MPVQRLPRYQGTSLWLGKLASDCLKGRCPSLKHPVQEIVITGTAASFGQSWSWVTTPMPDQSMHGNELWTCSLEIGPLAAESGLACQREPAVWMYRRTGSMLYLCQGLSIGLDVVCPPEHHSHGLRPLVAIVQLLSLQQPVSRPIVKSGARLHAVAGFSGVPCCTTAAGVNRALCNITKVERCDKQHGDRVSIDGTCAHGMHSLAACQRRSQSNPGNLDLASNTNWNAHEPTNAQGMEGSAPVNDRACRLEGCCGGDGLRVQRMDVLACGQDFGVPASISYCLKTLAPWALRRHLGLSRSSTAGGSGLEVMQVLTRHQSTVTCIQSHNVGLTPS